MKRALERALPREIETDAELLAEIAEGRLSALGRLYDRHRQAVVAFVARSAGSGADVEDITQTTFMTVARIANGYDPARVQGETCRPWLLGIAARNISQHRRGWSRFTRFLGRLAFEGGEQSYDPEPVLAARGTLTKLQRALDALSPQKRVVLVMFEVEGISCEAIASALEIPIGTVWTRLHAARREIRVSVPEGGS